MGKKANEQLIKILSAATVVGDVKAILRSIENDGESVPLFRLFGICDQVRIGESTNGQGEWELLGGQLKAINHTTGEVFQGVEANIPRPLRDLLVGAIMKTRVSQKDGKKSRTIYGAEVQFALDVHMKRNDKAAVGYEYIGVPLIKARDNDAMAALEAEVAEFDAPALPAPDAEGKKAKAKA